MPEAPFTPLGRERVFFKYLNIDASIATLANKTLKWANARPFNDPFGMPPEVSFAFDGVSFANARLDEMARLAFGTETPIGDVNNQLFAVCMQTRGNRTRGATEPEFRKAMSRSLAETAERFARYPPLLERQLQAMREQFALLCVSKTNESLLMSAHYAKEHTGCVLGLRCLPELDCPLCAVKQVKYLSDFRLMATLPEYVQHLTGQSELDTDSVFERFALAKSEDGSYEQDWRGLRATLNKSSIAMVTEFAAKRSWA